jgi:hypothetical protein
MPVDYSLGKVYKIVGNGKVYVGSTCERLLCQRFAEHKSKYKRGNCYVTSFECLSDPECYIELLELCPCSCVDELRKCEGKWIRDLDCVNRKIEGRTKKEYYEEHKEEIKTYQQENKEEIAEHRKAHYTINQEVILEKKKTYYQANREAILEKAKSRYYENKKK